VPTSDFGAGRLPNAQRYRGSRPDRAHWRHGHEVEAIRRKIERRQSFI
jgi:hypothetical protein